MELVNEIIESYNEYLLKIPNGALYIAENLRTENIAKSLEAILDFSEGMKWIIETNILLKQHGIELDLDIKSINEFLLEINEGLEREDYTLVSDIFEYEIAQYFSDLK